MFLVMIPVVLLEEGIPLIRRFLACLCVVMLISAFGQTICGPNELAVDIEE